MHLNKIKTSSNYKNHNQTNKVKPTQAHKPNQASTNTTNINPNIK